MPILSRSKFLRFPVKSLFAVLVTIALFLPFTGSATDYRNKTGGNWDNLAIWEEWSANNWIPASSVPKDVSGNIYISGYVTISSFSNLYMGTLFMGGTLTIEPSNFTIHGDVSVTHPYASSGGINGNGRLFINGTLYMNGGSIDKETYAVSTNLSPLSPVFGIDVKFSNLQTAYCNIVGRGIMRVGKLQSANISVSIPGDSTDFVFDRIGGSDSIINTGNFSVSGAGNLRVQCPLYNEGNMYIATQALFGYTGGGGVYSLHNKGTFTVQAPSVCTLSAKCYSGSSFAGNGKLVINDILTLDADQSFPSSLNLSLSGVNVDGPGNLTINGNFTYENSATRTIGGTGLLIVNGDLTWRKGNISRKFVNSQTMNINILYAANSNEIRSDSIINNGTLNISGGNNWYIGYYLENNGQLNFNNAEAFATTGYGNMINNGAMTKTGAGDVSIGYYNFFTNNGTVSISNGKFIATKFFYHYGTLLASGNGIFEGSLNLFPSGQLVGNGTLINTSSWTLEKPLVIPGDLTFINKGWVFGNFPLTVNGSYEIGYPNNNDYQFSAITVNGTATWKSGNLKGPVTVTPGGTLHIKTSAQTHNLATTITNNGTLVINAGNRLQLPYNGDIINNNIMVIEDAGARFEIGKTGGFTNTGTFKKVGAGSAAVKGLFTNHGNLQVLAGELVFEN